MYILNKAIIFVSKLTDAEDLCKRNTAKNVYQELNYSYIEISHYQFLDTITDKIMREGFIFF